MRERFPSLADEVKTLKTRCDEIEYSLQELIGSIQKTEGTLLEVCRMLARLQSLELSELHKSLAGIEKVESKKTEPGWVSDLRGRTWQVAVLALVSVITYIASKLGGQK